MATTPIYGEELPTNNADFDTWGTKNNNLHEAWDDALGSPTNTIKGRNTAGTGPHQNLTPTEIAAMLPTAAQGVRGVVKASAADETNRVLTGDGNFRKGIGRFAGAQCVRSGNQVLGGLNIASAVWNGAQRITVTFSTPASNVNYQVHAFPMSNDPAPVSVADNLIVRNDSKTVNGFALDGNVAHTAMSISVFEG